MSDTDPYYIASLSEALADADGKVNALDLGYAMGYFSDRFKDLPDDHKARIIAARAAAERNRE